MDTSEDDADMLLLSDVVSEVLLVKTDGVSLTVEEPPMLAEAVSDNEEDTRSLSLKVPMLVEADGEAVGVKDVERDRAKVDVAESDTPLIVVVPEALSVWVALSLTEVDADA